MQTEDVRAVFAYRSDKETNKYQGWVPETEREVYDFIQNRIVQTFNIPETWFQFVLVNKENGQVIGDIGVHFLGSENKLAELGYTLGRNYHGKGLAREALAAILDCLFNKYNKHRVIASVDPANLNSIKLLERLNFRKEAHFIESVFVNGTWADDVVYAILKREWNAF